MKVLVIGARGQLAIALKEVATFQQVNVTTLGRPELDLVRPKSIRSAVKRLEPQIVINTAAYTAADEAEEHADLAYALNRDGAHDVAKVCAETNTPLIHISTDYVFDGSARRPNSEVDCTIPLNVYGMSKLEGERAVSESIEQHVILRTAWVHSPFANNFVKTILSMTENQHEIRIVNDQIGNPTYAPHLATGILEMCRQITRRESKTSPWGTYHLTGSGEATWYELAREVVERSRSLGGPTTRLRAITTREYPTKAIRPADSRLDCSKCQDAFGIKLPEWRSGVADCVKRLLTQSIADIGE